MRPRRVAFEDPSTSNSTFTFTSNTYLQTYTFWFEDQNNPEEVNQGYLLSLEGVENAVRHFFEQQPQKIFEKVVITRNFITSSITRVSSITTLSEESSSIGNLLTHETQGFRMQNISLEIFQQIIDFLKETTFETEINEIGMRLTHFQELENPAPQRELPQRESPPQRAPRKKWCVLL